MHLRIRNNTPDVLIVLLLFLLPLMMFWSQTMGGKTLLPAENLYQFEPYATYREVIGAPEIPHNALLSDMVLQNMQWKAFIRQNIAQGDVPLWNPHQFAGIPFMAAGQPSTLYPLSVIYYIMPLEYAYGWFVVVNLWLCGVMMYLFIRGLRLTRPAAVIAAITYQLCGFFIASAVFPMMLGGAVWMPLLLLMVEFIARRRPLFGVPAMLPWAVIGAAALGMNIFAGHVEITYYTILITAYYGLFRLVHDYWTNRNHYGARREWSIKLGWMTAMGVLGLALGAVQFVPLYELVSTNWRASGKTFAETLDFAHPPRDVLQFVMPNFYGSPADHDYFDVIDRERVTVDFINEWGQRKTNTYWGIKNYVEGALYVGIFPLILTVYGLVDQWGRMVRNYIDRRVGTQHVVSLRHNLPPYRAMFAVLGWIGLLFMFGTPLYALVYYGLPGLNQSHTPFRWVYAVTISVAVLAAFGFECLSQLSSFRIKQVFAWLLTVTGVVTMIGLQISRFMFDQIEPFFENLRASLALANTAFPNAQAFYSYQYHNIMCFGQMTLMSGVIFWIILYTVHRQRRRNKVEARLNAAQGQGNSLWAWLRPDLSALGWMSAIMLVAMDLMTASHGFNPASDPELLRFTPPVIEWMQQQPGEWRFITLDDLSQPPLMHANMTWRYGLDDVRGYESIIPKQYVDYMRSVYPQVQLDFNRIAPIYTTYEHVPGFEDFDYRDALTNPRLHLLNVKYVVTHLTTDISDVDGYSLVYEDEAVRVWENVNARPRAFLIRNDVLNAESRDVPWNVPTGEITVAEIVSDTGRELLIDFNVQDDMSLIVSQSYFQGWRAFSHQDNGQEIALSVELVNDNFVLVPLGRQDSVIRLVYSPTSFQIGFFTSAISGLLSLFLIGVWLWQRFVIASDTDGRALLARNSVAPVILNLFNRGIDFVFAFVMLRILGPADTGIYYYAVIVFVWFDIFTNFGLDVFVMREASRDRDRAGRLFVNTTAFRLLLSVIGIVILLAFIGARQNLVAEPFDTRGIIAILLLYVGLIPGSLSKGMTSLYYSYERAEYPAAVSTVTTINKAVFGLIVLLAGFGIIGLAAVSIVNNVITLAILMIAGRDMLGSPSLRPEWAQTRSMARESYPLMLNHFLATIFFQIDVVILEAMRSAAIVGKYSVGYRWLLALNVIPSFFTMAIFPRMSRQAQDDRALLQRNYVLSLKMLAGLVFPVAVLLTFLARPLTLLLGGQEFLPEGAIALQIMVWSMPLGWMNSLTQYLLIALDRQQQLTWAFVVGVVFNICTNLIFIPLYGFRAAAVTTIFSELILMIGFAVLLRTEMRGVNWFNVLLKPGMASAVMVGGMVAGATVHLAVAVVIGVVVYPVVWVILRPLSGGELDVIAPLLPGRVRGVFRLGTVVE